MGNGERGMGKGEWGWKTGMGMENGEQGTGNEGSVAQKYVGLQDKNGDVQSRSRVHRSPMGDLLKDSYQGLEAWQEAVNLAKMAYTITRMLPVDERFGLIQQIRRSSTSVPANIAEGYGRWTTREYIRFLGIANGSLKEVETHIHVANQLGILDDARARTFFEQSSMVGRLLHGLRRSLLRRE